MSLIAPAPGLLPTVATAPGQPTTNQGPAAAQAVAGVAALGVRTETRMAATASGNSGSSAGSRGDKGRNADNNANATEARTDRAGPRPRGMGRNADVTV
ncbi:hypothetical protein V6B08_04615 [Ferrovibrio sp. MS7]|jgi:hypothetical protein|uniref:hypothetical protein n=1 Tax=Ferrovibrio plantarum TaxID=3119164 RepID=UPI003136F421